MRPSTFLYALPAVVLCVTGYAYGGLSFDMNTNINTNTLHSSPPTTTPERSSSPLIPPHESLINPGDLQTARFSDASFYKAGGNAQNVTRLLEGLPLISGTTFFSAAELSQEGASSLHPCNTFTGRPIAGEVKIWVPDAPRMTQVPVQCPIKCTILSGSVKTIPEADAVVVDSARSWDEDWKVYDWRSNPLKKVLIGWNIENIEGRRKMLRRAYKHRYIGRDYTPEWWDNFNLSVSYPMGADIPLSYYNWALCRDVSTSKALNHFANPTTKKKEKRAAAFVSSNCEFTSHWRDAVVLVLRKHFPVHGYGKCMNSHHMKDRPYCKGSDHPGHDLSKKSVQKACLMAQYPFTLVVENSISVDYVTEKVYEPLFAGSIPVYLGAPNVENFLPTSRSIIKISDFPSIESLARYLDCLLGHEEMLQEYLGWRGRAVFKSWEAWRSAYPPLCTACMRIHKGELNKRRRPHFVPHTFDENRNTQKPIEFCFNEATRGGKK